MVKVTDAPTRVQRFDTLRDFEGIVDSLDSYAKLPLIAKDEFGEYKSQRVYGIVNTTTRNIAMACGPEYPVFGHREAYNLLIAQLKDQKVDVHGRVEVIGERTYAMLLFNNLKVMRDDKDGVELGISFSNPMDRKTSFKGSGYTWRQTCSNGAGVKTLLPSLEINERHTSTMPHAIPAIMRGFIGESMKQTDHMQGLIDRAMATKIVFENREQLEATLALEFEGVSEKHLKMVLANVRTLEPTRWELFNDVTYHSSHSAVSPDIRERLDVISEKFINVNRPIIPVPLITRGKSNVRDSEGDH